MTMNNYKGRFDEELEKQYPYVDDKGIYIPSQEYAHPDDIVIYKCVLTKELFVDAYNLWIRNDGQTRRGKWIELLEDDGFDAGYWICSECRHATYSDFAMIDEAQAVGDLLFCPHCGVKMDGGLEV